VVCLVVSYLLIYLDILFLKFDYFKKFDRVFTLYGYALIPTLLYSIYQLNKHSNTLKANNTELSIKTETSDLNKCLKKILTFVFIWIITKLFWKFVDVTPSPQLLHIMNYIGITCFILFNSKNFKINVRIDSLMTKEVLYIVLLMAVQIYEWNEVILTPQNYINVLTRRASLGCREFISFLDVMQCMQH
jgi:hypothetical protein